MDDFKDRLVDSMTAAVVEAAELAAAVGVSQQSVSGWRLGKFRPEPDKIIEIAEFLHVDPGWLALGPKGRGTRRPAALDVRESIQLESLDKGAVGNRNTEPARPAPQAVHQVPLISWTSAGPWTEAVDPFAAGEADHWISVTQPVGPNAFALEVRGDSMAPEFPEGCVIIVDPARKAVPGAFVVARNDDWDEATFKRYVVESGIPYLKPLNPEYRTTEVAPGTKIAGVVVAKYVYKRY